MGGVCHLLESLRNTEHPVREARAISQGPSPLLSELESGRLNKGVSIDTRKRWLGRKGSWEMVCVGKLHGYLQFSSVSLRV